MPTMQLEFIGAIAEIINNGDRGLVLRSSDQTLTITGMSEDETIAVAAFKGQTMRLTLETMNVSTNQEETAP